MSSAQLFKDVDKTLWERLRAQGIHTHDICRNFDKAGLVRWHHSACVEYRKMVRTVSDLFHVIMDHEGPACDSPLSSLRKIGLRELSDIGNVRENKRRLHGKFCVKALKTVGVLTVLEDEHGDAAIVLIDHAVPTTATEAEVWERFPEGVEMVFKEPLYQPLWKDGPVGLTIINPANIVPAWESCVQLVPSPVSAGGGLAIEGPVTLRLAEDCRVEGNHLFALKLWKRAADAYNLGITMVTDAGMMQPQETNDREVVRLKEMVTLLYSNQSEAYLRMRDYEKARENAAKALDATPGHVKSLMRMAQSLHELQRYEDAISYLEKLQSQPSPLVPETSVTAGIESARTALRQRAGIYELENTSREKGCRDASAPNCLQFVGPVELSIGTAHARRGLFATRGIKAGELLLVSKALAVGRPSDCRPKVWVAYFDATDESDGSDECTSELVHNLVAVAVARAQESGRFGHQLYGLQGIRSEWVTTEVLPLSLYTEDWEDDVKYPKVNIDVRRIREIVINNHFPQRADSVAKDDLSEHAVSLQGLSSFLNHSCAPNCTQEEVGDFMFVSSNRDIQTGDELTIGYFGLFGTAVQRKKLSTETRPGSFTCNCLRCRFEFAALLNLAGFTGLAAQFHWNFEEEKDSKPLIESAEIAVKLEKIFNEESTASSLSQEQQDWLRCCFAIAYVVPFVKSKCFGTKTAGLSETIASLRRTFRIDHLIRALRSVDPASQGLASILVMGYRGQLDVDEEVFSKAYFRKELEEWDSNVYRPFKDRRFLELLNSKKSVRVFLDTFVPKPVKVGKCSG